MRRARNDGRRSASPGATGPGWYRADEREMPRRPPRHLDSGPRPRPSLRLPHAPQVAWLHRSRYPDAGAWHRCKHGGLFCGEGVLLRPLAYQESNQLYLIQVVASQMSKFYPLIQPISLDIRFGESNVILLRTLPLQKALPRTSQAPESLRKSTACGGNPNW